MATLVLPSPIHVMPNFADPCLAMLSRRAAAEKGEEWTAFSRIEDGGRAVAAGDVVRLGMRPAVVGTVLHFAVQQVCSVS